MPYVYAKAAELQEKPKVGSHHCVALIQHYAIAPPTSSWREGIPVRGADIPMGTAIATFTKGKYANASTGNHAAFYLGQDDKGIWVMDQWENSSQKPLISKRHIRFLDAQPAGSNPTASNNGDAYSVIE